MFGSYPMPDSQKTEPCGGNTFLFLFILLSIFTTVFWLVYLLLSDEPIALKNQVLESEIKQRSTSLYFIQLQDELSMQRQKISQLSRHNYKLQTELKNSIEKHQLLLSEPKMQPEERLIEEIRALKQKLSFSENAVSLKQQELDKVYNNLNITRQKSGQQVREIELRKQELATLKQLLSNTDIKISDLKNRFTVFEMKQEILFNEGEARLNKNGKKTISDLAKIFRQFPQRQIAIQGHTDNQAVGKSLQKKFTSNWELAAARSASAIHFLQNIEEIKPQRMVLVSYSEYRPIHNNSTIQGQANNRRIEIILMPKDFDFFRETTAEITH